MEVNEEVLDFYLESKAASMTIRELSAATGLSKSAIDRRLKRNGIKTGCAKSSSGLRQKSGTSGTRKAAEDGDERSELERLCELRDLEYKQILLAEGASVPRLASEYRATMERIAELQGADAEDEYDFGDYG